ncbi:MAG: phosphotriesterase-related protein [Pseudomonadota bacterium]
MTDDRDGDGDGDGRINNGEVMTVQGPVSPQALGITMMHEHILNDCSCWWHPPATADRQHLADAPVSIENLSELRQDPFVSRHNITLDDEPLAVEELGALALAGGRTVVDPTCRGIGRNPEALRRISAATGLNIIMGAGYYLHTSHPPGFNRLTADDICEDIVREAHHGVGDTGVRIGLIGEIGVSSDFTEAEQISLRGAARAQKQTGLPLMVHLPGWFRLGHAVLDLVAAEGGSLANTILCHLNPAHDDFGYLASLGTRGAFLEFDMIGMDYYYADQGVQCPSDEEVARAIMRLVATGFSNKILLSQDVFLKMMLSRYGGNGYAFVLNHFLPRLKRLGLDPALETVFMVDNPRRALTPYQLV